MCDRLGKDGDSGVGFSRPEVGAEHRTWRCPSDGLQAHPMPHLHLYPGEAVSVLTEVC